MKPLDEVITIMDGIDQTCTCCAYQHVCDETECIEKTALHYLKEYRTTQTAYVKAMADYEELKTFWAESQANTPLTWDELKGMEGKPVWVEIGNGWKGWVIIRKVTDSGIVSGSDGFIGLDTVYGMDTTWQAYRKER